jgi:hypothetical protein
MKPNLKLKSSKEEKEVYEDTNDGKEWKNESEGEDGRKSGRNKEGGVTICRHLFVSTPYNYDYANCRAPKFLVDPLEGPSMQQCGSGWNSGHDSDF